VTDEVAARVLDTAADLIDKHGWVQRSWGSEKTGYCALGATLHAMGELTATPIPLPDFNGVIARANGALAAEIGLDSNSGIVGWNDAFDRTQDEVVDHMRWAAKRLRGGAQGGGSE
jgi:hypothetical protein